MNGLVVFAVIAVSFIAPGSSQYTQQIPDTPEVAAAKQRFYAEYNRAAQAAAAAPDPAQYNQYQQPQYNQYQQPQYNQYQQPQYRQPAPTLSYSYNTAPQQQYQPQPQYQQYQPQQQYQQYQPQQQYNFNPAYSQPAYRQPQPIANLAYRPQQVQDTPEVQQAKAEFFKLYSAAATASAQAKDN